MLSKLNPVQYAEQVLDVHGPWVEAQDRLKLHAEASESVDQFKREMRARKRLIDDRKLELASAAPLMPGWPDKGVTAQRDFIKQVVADDDKLRELEASVAECQSAIEEAQSQVRHHELGIGFLTARLTELGGLLHFYAEAKAAETQTSVHKSISQQVNEESTSE